MLPLIYILTAFLLGAAAALGGAWLGARAERAKRLRVSNAEQAERINAMRTELALLNLSRSNDVAERARLEDANRRLKEDLSAAGLDVTRQTDELSRLKADKMVLEGRVELAEEANERLAEDLRSARIPQQGYTLSRDIFGTVATPQTDSISEAGKSFKEKLDSDVADIDPDHGGYSLRGNELFGGTP